MRRHQFTPSLRSPSPHRAAAQPPTSGPLSPRNRPARPYGSSKRSSSNCVASRVGRSGTADDTGWTRIEREHGVPPVGMHLVYATLICHNFVLFLPVLTMLYLLLSCQTGELASLGFLRLFVFQSLRVVYEAVIVESFSEMYDTQEYSAQGLLL
jgi:hypothetical protein